MFHSVSIITKKESIKNLLNLKKKVKQNKSHEKKSSVWNVSIFLEMMKMKEERLRRVF